MYNTDENENCCNEKIEIKNFFKSLIDKKFDKIIMELKQQLMDLDNE